MPSYTYNVSPYILKTISLYRDTPWLSPYFRIAIMFLHYDKYDIFMFDINSGGRLNIKMSSYQFRDPDVKDKTISRPSYL